MSVSATVLSRIFIYEDNAYLIPNRSEDLSLVLQAINEDSPIKTIYLSAFKGITEIEIIKNSDNIVLRFENIDNKDFSIAIEDFETNVDNFASSVCDYIRDKETKNIDNFCL